MPSGAAVVMWRARRHWRMCDLHTLGIHGHHCHYEASLYRNNDDHILFVAHSNSVLSSIALGETIYDDDKDGLIIDA